MISGRYLSGTGPNQFLVSLLVDSSVVPAIGSSTRFESTLLSAYLVTPARSGSL